VLPLLLVAAAACSRPQTSPTPNADDARQIIAGLQASAQAWNRNDLEGFIAVYADGPNTTFIGQDVVHGKDAIRDFYRSTWFRTGSPPGELTYDRIDVRPLGRDHALAVGHWHVLMRSNNQMRNGIFSLTYERTPQGWRIIHDHSG
jgi:uncharacterized protein (TIGR02246 family)